MNEIKLFFFVLCLVYLIKVLVTIGIKFTQTEPEPMKFSIIDKIFLYLSTSYVITWIILSI